MSAPPPVGKKTTSSAFDPAKMKLVKTVKHSAGFLGGTFEVITNRFLAGCIDGSIMAYAYPAFGKPTLFGRGHRSFVNLLVSAPRSGQVISAGFDRRLFWWGCQDGQGGPPSDDDRPAAGPGTLGDEPTSLTDVYALIKVLKAGGASGDIRVVVNAADSEMAGERTYAALRKACETFLKFKPPLAGVIRRDVNVPAAIRRQTAFLARHPASPAARDVEAVCRGLEAPP